MKINKFLVQIKQNWATAQVCRDLDVLWCWALAGRAGRAQARRWACRLDARRAGRARRRQAWARGLALGSALGALGPFSIRFDSFFFLSH